ncbi:ABC transporter permease [uncultured Maribacter sp.]|uniref:ABC transporter permease n=1 Tax=uncultured Maribacter sp. TaxID=431308 RepID=UPI002607F1E1|nr:ABC transporter permease [uncultured Maribacter sp.]
MNNLIISLKNLFHKPLYVFLSIFSLSTSVALLLGIQKFDSSIQNQFENGLGNIEMVVGAKGSPLQLVLSSVLHIDNPTGNIPYTEVQKLSKNPMIKDAVPISYGDNYKGYRIVGSTLGFAKLYEAELLEGKEVNQSLEVILGNDVAKKLGLKLGDTFLSSHGLTENTIEEHDQSFTVVGIYKPTYKVIDRLIITNLASIWDVHHHKEEKEEIHDTHEHEENHEHEHERNTHEIDEREVTSILVSFKSPMGLMTMPRNINAQTNMQAALPKYELERLFQFTGVGVKAISWIAYVILLISCITIFISLYKMVKERAFDLALMRTYGASNFQLFCIVAVEGIIMVLVSLIIGFLFSQIGLYYLISMFKSQFQQDIVLTFSTLQMVQTLGIIIVIAMVSIVLAILPILKMNISKIISDEK